MLKHHTSLLRRWAVAGLAVGLATVTGLALTEPPAPTAADKAPAKAKAFEAKSRPDKWWIDRHESFNARAKQGAMKGDIKIVFMGDSITQGWEKEGKDVWTKAYGSRGAVNFGIGGDRTNHVAWRIDHGNLDGLATPKEGSAPKLVVLMIGTNNSGDESAQEIAAGVGEVVARIRAKLPATKVLLLGIFPRSEKPDALRQKVAEASVLASKLADGSKVQFLDIGAKFVGADGVIDKAIMPDFLHLSPAGYQIWADAIEPAVKQTLGE